MSEERFSEVRNRILQAENILLATHLKPDGDAIGSTLALADFLKCEDVDILICGGIGGGAQAALFEAGIRLFGGAEGPADAQIREQGA